MSRGVLLLPPAAGDLPLAGVVLQGTAPMNSRRVEPAGEEYQRRLRGEYTQGDNEEQDAAKEQEDQPPISEEENSNHQAVRRITRDSDDYYELLNLGDLRWRATEDDIRKAFRKMSLKYHPDKLRQAGGDGSSADASSNLSGAGLDSQNSTDGLDDSEELFKKIRKAYETLSDKKKRASYDSIDDFDDSIPTWNPRAEYSRRPQEFYSRFGACFDLNARWSTASRVPRLGADDDSDSDVDAFYEFWFNFKSWREFSMDQEYDPDQAESREERRWIDRQNAKRAKARKLEEAARIRTLVELAYRYDPRVVRRKEAEKEAKEAAKRKKREEREAAENSAREREEMARREAAEREEKEKTRRAAEKKEREKAKKAMQKARRRLRDACKGHGESVLVQVEYLCSELSSERLDALGQRLEDGAPANVASTVIEVADAWRRGDRSDQPRTNETSSVASLPNGAASSNQKPEISRPTEKGQAADREWSVDELSTLSKALNKYPAGTRERWSHVSELMETRTPEECLKKANELRNNAVRPESAQVDAFERFQQKKKSDPSATNQDSADLTSTKPNGPPKTTKSSATTPSSGPPNSLGFSKKQQSALEEAMKKFPASLGSGRWEKVAGAVPGRSPTDCEGRFKELVLFYKSRKNSS